MATHLEGKMMPLRWVEKRSFAGLSYLGAGQLGFGYMGAAVRNCLGITTSYTPFCHCPMSPGHWTLTPFSNLTGPIMVSKVSLAITSLIFSRLRSPTFWIACSKTWREAYAAGSPPIADSSLNIFL